MMISMISTTHLYEPPEALQLPLAHHPAEGEFVGRKPFSPLVLQHGPGDGRTWGEADACTNAIQRDP